MVIEVTAEMIGQDRLERGCPVRCSKNFSSKGGFTVRAMRRAKPCCSKR